MKQSKSISRPEGYQANGLHEASLNNSNRGSRLSTIGSTTEPASKSRDIETPTDKVKERNHEIQEEKIHDVSEKNDTMHNPDLEIGKSYVVTTANQNGKDDKKLEIKD